MQPISRMRVIIIAVVTLIAIYQTIPTARYYLAQRDRPAVESERPLPTRPRPPVEQVEEVARWEEENPDVIAWEEDHPEFVEWESRSERLLEKAIPLGLDLRGGADVILQIDEQQAIKNEVSGLMERVNELFDEARINAVFTPAGDGQFFTITLDDPTGDARSAANEIARYGDEIEGGIAEADFRAGPVNVRLDTTLIQDNLRLAIDGARKGITERVDALGVTQPRISIQGGDRIRVQVPGEKNPDVLIARVIQPAFLEFRMVHGIHNDTSQILYDPDGNIRPDVIPPAGAEIVEAKLGNLDTETRLVQYTNTQLIVMRAPMLTGEHLRSANVFIDPSDFSNPVKVNIEFNTEGAQIFAEETTKYAGQTPPRQLAILLDGVVRSYPNLQTPITDGRAVISGGFSHEEARDLSEILKAGSLPAPLKIESKRTVGASLGSDSIVSGFKALALGALIVTVFMILYYGTAGVISVIALALNVLIILAIMSLSRATLTLSGIGGILLTVGMAVDANVLIYERIREEINSGRPLRQAISVGFGRAFTVILDSNLTTLLTALVLLQFTAGSVFGFALTMTFGLLANLFTGLTVTYTLCALWFSWRGALSLGKLAIFRNTAVPFIKMRLGSWILSIIVLVISLFGVLRQGGLEFGVDFAGGIHSEVQFDPGIEMAETDLRSALEAEGFSEPRIQPVVDAPNMFYMDLKLDDEATAGSEAKGPLQVTEDRLRAGLTAAFQDGYSIVRTDQFGRETGQEFANLAILVVLLASIAILIYLWFRFELAFGVAAVIALVHDLTIVVAVSQLWGVAITLEVVAALMVLLGFSVNDTIVIFDRIRENTRKISGKSFQDLCNLSMNQSLSRTVITSGTMLLAVLMLFFIGGEALRPFSKVILLGAIVGTYSSNFLAVPLVFEWNRYKGDRLQQQLAARKKKRVEAAKPIGRRKKTGE